MTMSILVMVSTARMIIKTITRIVMKIMTRMDMETMTLDRVFEMVMETKSMAMVSVLD